jgi:hypothetical protein
MNAQTILENVWLIGGIVIVGLLASVGLLAIGLNLWGRERKPKETNGTPVANLEEKKPAFQLAIPAAIAERLPARAAPQDPSANEVLRVLRDKLTGRVVVEISGRRYAEMSEVKESEVRRALLLTTRDLQEFVGVSVHTVGSAPVAATVPAPAATIPAPTPTNHIETSASPVQLNPAPLPKAPVEDSGPLRAPSMNLFKQFAVARELNAKELPPIRPLAEQIDDVLQHLITGTPFAAQNLHVASGPSNGVIFEVGTQVFNAVDEIPDATLQTVFREAIRRWEQQQ